MKILQVFDFFSLPHGGGTVDVIARLSKALAERGHEVSLFTGNFNFDTRLAEFSHIQWNVFPSNFNQCGLYYMPMLKREDVSSFDVIHFHCYRSYQNSVLYHKAIKAGVPYVIDAHGSTVDKGPKNILRQLYDVAWGYDSLKHASRVIAETEIGVAEWRKLGVPDSKIALLHPFIDTHEFENLPEKGKYKIAPHMVLFLGRINKDKGLEFLVRAFKQLAITRLDVMLMIVGQDDGYVRKLNGIISDCGLNERVRFGGFLSGEWKLSALVDADMLIQPSRNEAGARPSLEALMCGIPVIVTDNTGAGLVIEAMDGGLTVEYGNVGMLKTAMQTILDDPEYAQIRVKKGQDYIKANLSLESQIPKYEKLYNEVEIQ